MKTNSLKKAFSALALAAVAVSATSVSAYADSYKYDAASGGAYSDKLTADQINAAEVKAKITATKEVITLDEAKANPTRTIEINIASGQDKAYYASTGIHYYVDSRLTIVTNRVGAPAGTRGDATEYLDAVSFDPDDPSINNPNDPDMQKGIFISSAAKDDFGFDGLMYSFQVQLPSDVAEGDVFPIDIKYVSVNTYDTFSPSDSLSARSRAIQAYAFTQGIYNAEYNNNFKADAADVEKVPALADIKGEYDGYIAIEAATTTSSTTTTTTTTSEETTTTSTTLTAAATTATAASTTAKATTASATTASATTAKATTAAATTAKATTAKATTAAATTTKAATTAAASSSPKTGVAGVGVAAAGLAVAVGTAFVLRRRED